MTFFSIRAGRPTPLAYIFHGLILFCIFISVQQFLEFGTAVRSISKIFSAQQHISYRALCANARPSVRLSICLSVTRVDQSKTVAVRIMQLSPQSSPMTLVSLQLTLPGVPNDKRSRKNTQFLANKWPSQKRCKIGPKLLLMTNRKSHMRF